ncbi:rod shape-determining protein RodA [Sphingomonas suaedae]|uniref:Peptidoglycan glycosyltransferase MrdB n=1 Tax=Sphingomonas suaedae TaxID=2599297 RepID=A0A518RCY4_9SPHN|nr:rod shape-determining protein RodA [Sphingomonas suaedae]QDX25264.1 rod shape-determining protein RodA [Sphingomonas suaedae]
MSNIGPGFVPAPVMRLPWGALLLVVAIGGFGTAMLYSAAGGSLGPWALSHGARFSIFLAIALAMSRVPVDWYRQLALPAYGICLVLIMLTELIGHVAGGAQSWLDLGFMRLQPSELMKLNIVLALARFYEMLPVGETRKFGAIWPAAIIILLPAALVLIQPDLGTAMMIIAGGATMMFLAGVPVRLFIAGGLAAAVAIPLMINYGMQEYQQKRVLIFLNPEQDPLGAGYHITQSKIAIGSGGLFGKGFGNGTQVHLNYLPEGHTDFVFALVAEEFGLVGGVALIAAFIALCLWAIGVATRANSKFERLTAAGISATIFFYVAINLLMVMGLAPVTGIPLPLVSHGGSSMMTVMFAIGILFAIDRQNRHSARTARW